MEFVKNYTTTNWNMVRIFLFSLITSIICTKPYIFLFLLYRLYLIIIKKNNLDRPDEFKHQWRDLRKEKCYFSRRNFGDGSDMVWGALYSRGTLPLSYTSPKMNSNNFVSVLDTHLLTFYRRFCHKIHFSAR